MGLAVCAQVFKARMVGWVVGEEHAAVAQVAEGVRSVVFLDVGGEDDRVVVGDGDEATVECAVEGGGEGDAVLDGVVSALRNAAWDWEKGMMWQASRIWSSLVEVMRQRVMAQV